MFSPLYADFFIDFAWKVCKQFVLYLLSVAGLISVRNDLTLYIAEFFCKLPEVFKIYFSNLHGTPCPAVIFPFS